MSEDLTTLTDSGGSPEAGDSSTSDPSTGELFETMDLEPETLPTEEPNQEDAKKEETLPDETKAKEAESQEKDKETKEVTEEPEVKVEPEKVATEDEDKNKRFDQEPRFKELIREKNELKERLAKLEQKAPVAKTPEKLGYEDIGALTPEEIQDWQDEDPAGFSKNMLAQAKAEIRADLQTEASQTAHRQKADKTLDDFVDKHPDFDAVYETGTLSTFCDENPGHTIISAYLALNEGKTVTDLKASFESDKKAAVDLAVKEATEKIQKQQKVKESVTVITGDATEQTVTDDVLETNGDLIGSLHRQMIKDTA